MKGESRPQRDSQIAVATGEPQGGVYSDSRRTLGPHRPDSTNRPRLQTWFQGTRSTIDADYERHVGRDRVIITSLLCAAPFCLLLAGQTEVGPALVLATAVSGMLLNGSFVVLAVRGQESMPGSLGMVSGLMLGLSIGLGGLAVAPMAIVAERAGLPPVFVAAGGLAIVGAALMRAVPHVPARTAILETSPVGS